MAELSAAEVVAVHNAVVAERDALLIKVADYENCITWDTTCTNCAHLLDASIADHERAEQAHALAEYWRGRWENAMTFMDEEFVAGLKLMIRVQRVEASLARVRAIASDLTGPNNYAAIRLALPPKET